MSEGRAQQELGPYSFEMTEEDARVAASRAGLRAALSGRLSRNHVAPLVAFALLMAFITILTLTGLIGRRLGDGALILAAGIYQLVNPPVNPGIVLLNLHANVWWGAALLVFGLIYCFKFAPTRRG